MQKLPPPVMEAFERVKSEHPGSKLVAAKIRGRYYIYSQKRIWLKEEKRQKTKSVYIGRISDDGTLFIKKRFFEANDLPSAVAMITEHGGEVVWHEKRADMVLERVMEDNRKVRLLDLAEGDRKVMNLLSANARVGHAEMSRKSGMGAAALASRIKALGKAYGLHYVAEVNTERLGFLPFIVTVKFRGRVPPAEAIRKVMDSEPRVQLAMLTKGKYDLLVYLLGESSFSLAEKITAIRSSAELKDYSSEWQISPFYHTYGYIPLRDDFFSLLRERVWHRTKSSSRPGPDSLLWREYALLKELNSDGLAGFAGIDRKYGLSPGSARAAYYGLMEKGVVLGVTITERNVRVKYNALILMDIIDRGEFNRTHRELLNFIIEGKNSPINKFSLVGDIYTVYGILFILPILSDGELQAELAKIAERIRGVEISTLVASDVLVGETCYRLLDNAESKQNRRIEQLDKTGS